MLCTTRAPTPRIVSSVDAPGVANVGIGLTTGSAGVGLIEGLCGKLFCGVVLMGDVLVPGVDGAGLDGAGVDGAEVETGAEDGAGGVAARFGTGGIPPFGAPLTGGRAVPVAGA